MSRSRLVQAGRFLLARFGRYRPVYAHYGVTHRCNMRCRMCSVWNTGNAATELTIPQVGRLAENLWNAGVRSIALGGGEPFVREDLTDLVRTFAGFGFDIRLLTNGIGIPSERIADVVRAGVRHFSVSLDSLDPKKQSFIYGDCDVWNEIARTIRQVRELIPAGGIPVLNTCVSRLNLDELPELVGFAQSMGCFASFVPVALVPSPEADDGFAAYAPALAVQPDDHQRLDAAYGALLRLKRKGAPIANSSRFLRDSHAFLKGHPNRWVCDAGRLYLSVSPEGAISVCHKYPPFAGWDAADLGSVLSSPEQSSLASRQRNRCSGCMRPCWAEISHVVHDWRGLLEAAMLVAGSGRLLRVRRK